MEARAAEARGPAPFALGVELRQSSSSSSCSRRHASLSLADEEDADLDVEEEGCIRLEDDDVYEKAGDDDLDDSSRESESSLAAAPRDVSAVALDETNEQCLAGERAVGL